MTHNLNVLQQTSLNVDSPRILILKNDLLVPSTKHCSPKMTRVHNPPPVAVARRNARERNRVKQVNNGFATLRQHIPSAIAAAYESGSGRSGNKKLSKVETLRMAVEYIKSLEKLLNISEDTSGSSSSNAQQFNITYTYSKNEDRLKQMIYEDEENIHPLKMEDMDQEILHDSSLVSTNLNSEDMSLLHSIDNGASLSPEVYSEHSLSPVGLETNDTKSYIPVFNVPNQTVLPSFSHIAYDRLPQVKTELLSPSMEEQQTVCVIRADGEPIDVIWWNQQQTS